MCKTVGNNAINNWYKGSHRQIGHFMPSPDAVLIYVGHNRIKNRASLCEFEVKCEMRIITLRIRILKIRRMRRPRCAYVLRRNFTFLRGEWPLLRRPLAGCWSCPAGRKGANREFDKHASHHRHR